MCKFAWLFTPLLRDRSRRFVTFMPSKLTHTTRACPCYSCTTLLLLGGLAKGLVRAGRLTGLPLPRNTSGQPSAGLLLVRGTPAACPLHLSTERAPPGRARQLSDPTPTSMAASAPKRARRAGCELFQWEPQGGSRQTGIRLTHGDGATAEVNLHGATVTSWVVGGEEMLFVRWVARQTAGAARREAGRKCRAWSVASGWTADPLASC